MPTTITPLSQLPLSDDFMFGEVMRQPEVCQLFLECLLEKEIARIEYISKQEDLSDDVSGHGIRLDVYLNDAAGTHYDIEMQKTSSQGLERRIRYYQGGIDRRCLGKGLDYTDLPESYVIFVCDFDYYHAGLARYERMSCINGREEGLVVGREEGREEGIRVLVVTLKRLSHAPDLVIQTVAEQFGLSPEEAEEKMKLYWEQ